MLMGFYKIEWHKQPAPVTELDGKCDKNAWELHAMQTTNSLNKLKMMNA